MTSVLAALYTDRKMIVYEKDAACVEAAWDRVKEVARKVTNKAKAPLGKVADGLYRKKLAKVKSGKRPLSDIDDESYEYSYDKILASHSVLRDPNFVAPDGASSYTVEAACEFYGVGIEHVSDEIGEGLFAKRDFGSAEFVVNIIGKFVR